MEEDAARWRHAKLLEDLRVEERYQDHLLERFDVRTQPAHLVPADRAIHLQRLNIGELGATGGRERVPDPATAAATAAGPCQLIECPLQHGCRGRARSLGCGTRRRGGGRAAAAAPAPAMVERGDVATQPLL